ncbi:hypothetical protein [Lampropedia aestuarii]|uniref:hypothetical protein n=1 Tax=Lampropedia aestuarii TaxID=2562762 RepID=UPI002468B292|nr:hypothetical protein [Lampropedia aestuarii]MDH5858676.1 hypothetical protein [Lampropedia aestuarii]
MPAPTSATKTRPASPNTWRTWRLAAALLALLLGTRLIAAFAQWPWLYWLLAWPGTVQHEASHWLVAWALQGSPSQFHVWPDWGALWRHSQGGVGGSFSLGSVQFIPNWYNSASVALAPLLLWPISLLWLSLALRAQLWGPRLLWLYLAASSISSAWPSSVDWQLAWQAPGSWPLALGLIALVSGVLWLWLRHWWQQRRLPPKSLV